LLNRFISRSAEKSLPFFKVLKGSENFSWGPEQRKAFEDLKQYLENLAGLTSPSPGGRIVAVHRDFELCGERSSGGREDGRRNVEAVPDLLRIRGPEWVEVIVLRDGEVGLYSGNGGPKASPLLLKLQDQSPDFVPSSGYV
jgi:hypothetical protein